MKSPLLLNKSELAKKLNCSGFYVTCMVKMGFVMSHGRKTMLKSALEWMAANPTFTTTEVYPRRKAAKPSPKTIEARRALCAGKFDGR